ncbi:MAG: phage holin family protein [Armatimonadaceae bacterium]
MQLLLRWIVGAVALLITVKIAEALNIGLALKTGDAGLVSAFIVILALTLVNAFIRPIVNLLTLPLNCLTFGLFSLVVNALMFWLVGALDLGLVVNGFLPALFGSVVLGAISGLLNLFIVRDKEK